jgi:hypothetical protein
MQQHREKATRPFPVESNADIRVGRAKTNERLRLENAAHALISLNGHKGVSSSMYFQEVECESEDAGEDSEGCSPVFSFREDLGRDEMSGGDGLSVLGGTGAVEGPSAEFSDDSLSSIEVWSEMRSHVDAACKR